MAREGDDRSAGTTRTLVILVAIAALFFTAIIVKRTLWP